MTGKKIKVLLADDHAVVRAGFRRLFEDAGDIEVIVETDTGEQTYKEYFSKKPDVVVTDLTMPGIGGLESIQRITAKDPGARILALSVHEDITVPTRTLQAGALGYVTKRCDLNVLIDAVRAVAKGERYLEHKIAQQLAVNGLSGEKDPMKDLTSREFEVFRLLAQGESVNGISDMLFLSPKTVGTYQTRIMHKLHVPNSASLTRLAIRKGLIEA